MKKIWFLITLALSFLVSSSGLFSLADLAGYTISNYEVEMNLYADGSMDVQETINVNFSESRHGIYRTIPFYSPSGRYTLIENFYANGDPSSFYTEGSSYQLRIGDANRTIIWPHAYSINYTVHNAIAGFWTGEEGRTELYRNIIGTQRATTIDHVHFTLQLPEETAFSSGDYYVLYGREGEKKTDWATIFAVTSTTFEGGVNGLKKNEGMTIGVKFPAEYFSLSEGYVNIKAPIYNNYVSTQSNYNTSSRSVGEKFFLWFLIFILGIFGIKIFGNFITKSHVPKRPVTIHYTPPKGVDISLASKVYSSKEYMREPRMFSAFIYYRASQGYLTISAETTKILWFSSTTYTLTRKNTPPDSLHNNLIVVLFSTQNEIKLSSIKYSDFQRFKTARDIGIAPTKSPYYTIEQKHFLKIFPYTKETLNEKGEQLYEEIRGFAHYLEHVEEPRLRQILKEDPDYIDKILPRAVLFGVETKFLKAVEEILGEVKQPQRYSGDVAFSVAMLHSLTNQIQSSATPPSDSGSGWGGSSGFSGWWGSSGGGWGGGWGGSR